MTERWNIPCSIHLLLVCLCRFLPICSSAFIWIQVRCRFYPKLSRQFNTKQKLHSDLHGPNKCWDEKIFSLWISFLLKVNTRHTVLIVFPKFVRALGLSSHYQRRQVSGETGRLVDTVIVKLLPSLICLPLWCLALSRPITRRRGLSGSSSSNLMKDSQLRLLLSARLQYSRNKDSHFVSTSVIINRINLD